MRQIILLLILSLLPTASLACPKEDSLRLMTIAIYREARGESIDGKIAVGEVIRNRTHSAHFEDTVCDVLFEKNQFQWTKKKNAFHITEKEKKDPMFTESRGAAEQILVHGEILLGKDALFFLNPDKLTKLPSWAKPSRIVGRIERHVFYSAKKEG